MKESVQLVRIEPRWPVVLTSIAVLILVVSLPARIRAFPDWVPYLIIITLNVPMVALALATDKRRWLAIEHVVMLLFFAGVGFTLADEVRYSGHYSRSPLDQCRWTPASRFQRRGVGIQRPPVLFGVLANSTAAALEARLNQPNTIPDWVFPHEENTALPNKNPTFVDYLFLAYWTATAFSPTDALPLSSRAKLLMMLESMVSLVTIMSSRHAPSTSSVANARKPDCRIRFLRVNFAQVLRRPVEPTALTGVV